MNKAELVDVIAKEAGTTKKDAETVINKMMETIVKRVASGEKVTLVGFGTFEVRQRKARTGRNPKTNQPLEIPAKRVPGFKVGKEFSSVDVYIYGIYSRVVCIVHKLNGSGFAWFKFYYLATWQGSIQTKLSAVVVLS